jgi:thioredoxin reductase (NADPH)
VTPTPTTEVDLVVVGGGPAGLSAALIAATDGWSVRVVDAEGGGGRLYKLDDVHDYPRAGVASPAADLASDLVEAAVAAGVELVFDQVESLAYESAWDVQCGGVALAARAVVLATGQADAILGLAGEGELHGRGLSYCASCDASLFVGKQVAVFGSDDWAVDEALQLDVHTSRTVLVCPADELEVTGSRRGALASTGITVLTGSRPTRLERRDGVLVGVQLSTPAGEEVLEVDGLFPLFGLAPALAAVPADVLDEAGTHVVVDAHGATIRPGLFAAGDVTHGHGGFVGEAIAEGVRAGVAASSYLRHGWAEHVGL